MATILVLTMENHLSVKVLNVSSTFIRSSFFSKQHALHGYAIPIHQHLRVILSTFQLYWNVRLLALSTPAVVELTGIQNPSEANNVCCPPTFLMSKVEQRMSHISASSAEETMARV